MLETGIRKTRQIACPPKKQTDLYYRANYFFSTNFLTKRHTTWDNSQSPPLLYSLLHGIQLHVSVVIVGLRPDSLF